MHLYFITVTAPLHPLPRSPAVAAALIASAAGDDLRTDSATLQERAHAARRQHQL
jgi:hypothetical protein